MIWTDRYMDEEALHLFLLWGQTEEDRAAVKDASVATPLRPEDICDLEASAAATCEARGRSFSDTHARNQAA